MNEYFDSRYSTVSTIMGSTSCGDNTTIQESVATWTVVTHNPVFGYVIGHQGREQDKLNK